MRTANTITALEVANSAPRFHCPQDNGRVSLAIAGSPAIVYLHGTPAEIITWAARVIEAAKDAELHLATEAMPS